MAARSLAAKLFCQRHDEEHHAEAVVVAEEIKTPHTKLFEAIEKCDLATVKELKRNLCFKDIQDKQGRTPLHVLADMKPKPGGKIKDEDIKQIFNVLIEGGCEVNCGDEFGNTPLKLAAEKECMQVLTCLLENKADIDKADKCKGDTPLHWAAKNGRYGSTKLLLKYRPHLNTQNKDKLTPLHLAVQHNKKEIVHILLLKGADKKLKDKNEFTALDIAERSGSDRTEIIALLKKPEEDLYKEGEILPYQGEHVVADSDSRPATVPMTPLNTSSTYHYYVTVKDNATAAIGPNAICNEYRSPQSEALPSPKVESTDVSLPTVAPKAMKTHTSIPSKVFATAPPEEDI